MCETPSDQSVITYMNESKEKPARADAALLLDESTSDNSQLRRGTLEQPMRHTNPRAHNCPGLRNAALLTLLTSDVVARAARHRHRKSDRPRLSWRPRDGRAPVLPPARQ